MDNSMHTTLLQLVEYQKKELDKYKTKLRDLVAAHKGLLKEKEALEASLRALNDAKGVPGNSTSSTAHNFSSEDTTSEVTNAEDPENSVERLKHQLSSLLNSLATLSAEKSRMEASFQADKKQLREEKELIEKKCLDLQNQVNNLEREVEEIKSKLIIERHERDREQNDHGAMMKELQKLLNNERSTKQQVESTLEEVKQKMSNSDPLLPQVQKYEKKINSLNAVLETTKRKLELYERKAKETPLELLKLQDEIKNLQIEHQTAIHQERERAKDVEESSRKLTAVQEDRVVNLETRLAELSEIVGSYDRLRQQDKTEIHKLKEHIAMFDLEHASQTALKETKDNEKIEDWESIVKKIKELQTKLLSVCQKTGKVVDFSSLFLGNHDECSNVHLACKDEYNKLKKEFDLYKADMKLYNHSSSQEKSVKEVGALQNQVKNLQESLKILSDKNREMEKEYQIQIDQLKKAMKNEKARFKETLSASEADYRGRLWLLEQQLQKQRERSLALLEEKEQELHSLQNTFQMFLPGYQRTSEEGEGEEDEAECSSANLLGPGQMRDAPHLIHYANELARRDVEIANLRKNKHKIESALRDLQKAAVSDTEKHREERQSLREEIARLKRCQTREGANLEYLKNVVLSFLTSNDASSKRHMCNAIAAVLKFSDSELEKVTEHTRNSWWGRSNYM